LLDRAHVETIGGIDQRVGGLLRSVERTNGRRRSRASGLCVEDRRAEARSRERGNSEDV
jgi:hypothetical protein